MRHFKYILLLVFIFGCNAPQVFFDYDQSVNFSKYSSYALFPDFRTGLSQLDDKRLLASLEKGLRDKGLVVSDSPGLYVNVYTERFEEDNRSSIGIGIGSGGGNVGVGVSGGIPVGQMDTFLRLTFDFIDVEKDNLVWQAVVEAPFDINASPEARQQRFDKIVSKALEGYPPK